MNERERQLIEGILNTGDRRLHNRCIQLLFHGQDASRRDERVLYKKNEYVVALENAVRTNFSGRHYQGLFPETYMVFESLFVTYLEHLNPEKLREIEDLKNWLFVAAGRFCNSNRSRINELLGIETSDLTEEFDDNSKENVTNDETGHDEVTPFIGGAVIKAQSTTNDVGNQVQTDDPNEPSDSAGWAESLLNSFIDKISNEYYRDLIRAIKIESVAVNTIAEEYGKTTDDIYRDYNRAWDKLLQVSLPDIRFRSKRLLKKHEADFDDTQADLLNKFFFSSYDLTTIAKSEGMKQDDLEKAIVKAYKVLLRVAKHEAELDEKEKRKEAREQRRHEKEEQIEKQTGRKHRIILSLTIN